MLKDSGQREQFCTGSVRDTQAGKGRFDLVPMFVVWLISCLYEEGAIKYLARNWEKGQPLGQYLKSANNHIAKLMCGMRDEPHALQAIWNLMGYVYTSVMIKTGVLPKELNDMPDQFAGADKKAEPLSQFEYDRMNTFFAGTMHISPGDNQPETSNV
jgi:hypothetical protein